MQRMPECLRGVVEGEEAAWSRARRILTARASPAKSETCTGAKGSRPLHSEGDGRVIWTAIIVATVIALAWTLDDMNRKKLRQHFNEIRVKKDTTE